jgi:type III pantothenate kinase
MYILGDIGNTETKICLVDSNNKIKKKTYYLTKKINPKTLSMMFKKSDFDVKSIKKILFCSVVPKSYNLIKKYLSKKFNIKCYEIKELNLKKLIKIKVNYKQIGSDRLANSISAIDNKNNFIILDFGTATTFDVLIKSTYHGGVIAPGIKLSLNTLSDRATLIPKINLKRMTKVVGIDTISAVRSGFFWGYAGLIDNIINLIKKETRKSFKIIITGGFSDLFKESIKTKAAYNKDITIKGLIKTLQLIK